MSKTIIIAEGGVNHNGQLELAKELVDAAIFAGADYIKFQTFKAELLTIESASKAAYQISSSTNKEETQYQMLKKLELSEQNFIQLKKYADDKGIGFLSTPFDLDSLEMLQALNLDMMKISSGDITNAPLLERVASLNLPVILSTGMSENEEVMEAINLVLNSGLDKDNLTILQCNTEYPTPYEDVNLLAMKSLESQFKIKVGFSDHTAGNECAFAAVALGAKVIEKHLTINQDLKGPDHKASANPDQFRNLVEGIRKIELAMGSDIKKASPSELKNLVVARKSIYAKHNISEGSVLSEGDFIMKRPFTGLSPMRYKELIGKKVVKKILKNELIKLEDLK